MAKELAHIEGTVANVLNKRIGEINFYGSLSEAKSTIINILSSPEIKQQDLATKYKAEINKMTSMRHLMSTVTTYLTGDKVFKTNVKHKK